MTAVLPACLLEVAFYLASVLESTRQWFGRLGPPKLLSAILWVSALVPYVVFSVQSGTFHMLHFWILATLFGILAGWYLVWPRHWIFDVGFLLLVAAPVAARVFIYLYLSPHPRDYRMDVLGHLAWIRLALVSLLLFRGWQPGAFGVWPRGREWGVGTVYFLVIILPLSFLATRLHLYRYAPAHGPFWQVAATAIGTFFGILWVVALSEELFFRGVVERAFLDNWRSPLLAILVSSVLYGCSHLWHSGFPNWQDAVVTTVLGVACGMGYASTGSVRTSMVTHALTVAAARVFFRS